MNTAVLVCSFYILINAHDLRSRDFVDALPGNFPKKCVIDWYGNPKTRFEYDGPPPSAFPSVVKVLPDARYALLRTPSKLQDLGSLSDGEQAFESVALPGRYIGGVQIWEAENLVKWGYPTEAESVALLTALARVGHPISKNELRLAKERRPRLRKVADLKACQSEARGELDLWKRLAQIRTCLEKSSQTQLTQLLVTNLAARNPNDFAKKMSEVARKHDLAELIGRALKAPLALREVP